MRVIHAGVGAVSKSDVSLADASNAIIIGFNVRPDAVAKAEAEQAGVEMRMYRVIYDAINDVSDAMKGMLAPKGARSCPGRSTGPPGSTRSPALAPSFRLPRFPARSLAMPSCACVTVLPIFFIASLEKDDPRSGRRRRVRHHLQKFSVQRGRRFRVLQAGRIPRLIRH